MKEITPSGSAPNPRIAIVASRFNRFIVDQLVEGARDALNRRGVGAEHQLLVWVPGAFELPLMAGRLAASGHFDAVIALGAVIRGDTPHFEYVSDAVTRGLGEAMGKYQMPISFGVLTTDNRQQAMERCGYKDANKGYEAALTAVEMAHLVRQIPPAR